MTFGSPLITNTGYNTNYYMQCNVSATILIIFRSLSLSHDTVLLETEHFISIKMVSTYIITTNPFVKYILLL